MQIIFEWQTAPEVLRTYSDADWVGCKESRISTTGGCITLGKHVLKGLSKTQFLVALSSGESELYATLKAAVEALGMFSMLKDLGWRLIGEIWGDASAALGIIHRRGLGKTRHVDIGLLWVQQTVAEKKFKFNKVLGKNNLADLDVGTMERHRTTLACEFTEGRSKDAFELHVIPYDDQDLCPDVREFCAAMNTNRSLTRRQRAEMVSSKCLCMIGRLTGSGQQVLQGNNWQVQGTNGLNAALLDQLWGRP